MTGEPFSINLWNDASINFSNLMKKVWTQAEIYSKKFGENDARFMFFQHYTALNLWLLISLDTFIEMTDAKDKKVSKYINTDIEIKTRYLLTHDQLNRISYATNTMFYVEDFIKSLMKGIEIPPKGKYFDFTKDLLKHLGITDPQKHKILNAPYQLRNSLHNNGYPYHDFEITLRGKKYIFEKGKQLDSTGWDHLYVFFDELNDLLIEIVQNTTVEKIPSISHTYIVI